MKKKKPLDPNTAEDQKNSANDTSEEWQNFGEAVRGILSIPPEKAKEIREKYSQKKKRKHK
jgi:hypothetical protein